MPDANRRVVVSIPLSHWRQIVSDIENLCGTSSEEIEILREAEVSDE